LKARTSLLNKFSAILLFVTSIIGASTLGIVAFFSTQASRQQVATTQRQIEQGIVSKGRVLTTNHALAVRGLALDNAFLDMQRLAERAVQEDDDLVYALFVNAELQSLAFSRRGDAPRPDTVQRDAWSGVGLVSAELLVRQLTVKRVRRMGQDLVEVAAPVSTEEGELLGTVRYGLSTRRMQEAQAQAEAEANSRLRSSLTLLAGLIFAATALGLLLSRVQAVRITRPVRELTKAAEDLASGARSVNVRIASGDELEILGHSFNRMVEQLEHSYRELEEMNRTLEHKVELRTSELATRNRDMRLVLDNVDQGFITLSPTGKIEGEHSLVIESWFGRPESGQLFAEYVGAFSSTFAAAFQVGWEQLEDGILPVEVSLEQLPRQASDGSRTWSLRYLPFFEEEQLEGVLMVVADITERLHHEREEAEQAELMQTFQRLMRDRHAFGAFQREVAVMMARILAPAAPTNADALRRTLHTLKGTAGVMGLRRIATICHELEDQLLEAGGMEERTLAELRSRWEHIQSHVQTFLGGQGVQAVDVSQADYADLVERLSRGEPPARILPQVLSWQRVPVSRSLAQLAEEAKGLAQRLGKGEIEVDVQAGSELRLDADVWTAFFADLNHVVRNAIDHGVEPPERRRARGKPNHAKLTLRAGVVDDQLRFEVIDDGAGVDWEAVASKAEERGLPHRTHAELVAALCSDGLSTRGSATELSGRGVGMAAFKARVDNLRGSIDVRSSQSTGTAWAISFPWREATRTHACE
jgi:HPt (histidine-containing phosphotransfer) domain-containing protein/HAMP domain-containing protein